MWMCPWWTLLQLASVKISHYCRHLSQIHQNTLIHKTIEQVLGGKLTTNMNWVHNMKEHHRQNGQIQVKMILLWTIYNVMPDYIRPSSQYSVSSQSAQQPCMVVTDNQASVPHPRWLFGSWFHQNNFLNRTMDRISS